MKRVYVFCEGQTEDTFVREVLAPHLEHLDIYLTPIVLRTGPEGKGGVTSYGKVRWQVERKCKEDTGAWITTMLDLYHLPTDFPAVGSGATAFARAENIEAAMGEDIGQPNFLPNLLVHEFEALLFSDANAFTKWFDDPGIASALAAQRAGFDSPEHVNNGLNTAPSKRIIKVCGRKYQKTQYGPLIAMDIGLDAIRQECQRFDAWIKRLEALAGEGC